MLQYDFDESVCCWIALTNQTLRRAVATRLADEEITLRQWEVLAWLSAKVELAIITWLAPSARARTPPPGPRIPGLSPAAPSPVSLSPVRVSKTRYGERYTKKPTSGLDECLITARNPGLFQQH